VREEEVEILKVPMICGLTKEDERRVNWIHDMVDTLHSMCVERVGMAEQVKPAKSFLIPEACELRDLIIERTHILLRDLIDKVRTECP